MAGSASAPPAGPWWILPITILLSIVEDSIQKIAGNAFLAILLVASLVYIGFKIFKKAKKAARS